MQSMRQKNILIFAGVLVLTVLSAVFIYPAGFGADYRPWKLGLDLVGGSYLVYEVDMFEVSSADRASVHAGLRDVIERRVNTFGVSEPLVYTAKEGDSHRIIAEVAGVKDTAEAIRQIGRTALLDFREVVEVEPSEEGGAFSGEPTVDFVATGLTGAYLSSARVDFDEIGQPQIAITFNNEGAKLFEELTEKNLGRPIAIFLDEELISSPVVQAKIAGGNAVITGRFTLEEARTLASLLSAGALPAPVEIISQQTIQASLGLNSLGKALYAGLMGTAAVILFMVLYYRGLGLYAAFALVVYLLLTLAVFKAVPITMTLAGIAGFILSVGMAVDANILIFERMKEELARGRERRTAIEEGFSRAWPSIRDSNITTVISTVILYFFTTSFVQGFALTLFIGVVVSMFSAITVTRTILRLW